ncbi:NAD(P)H-hydrate epimerase, partial [Clostridium perfringens]|uniref:NAD(P)H-hydrate epimerase n=1 Tax=Clostridium perfringens TaxID=1502 RepID=UPI002ACC15D0
MLVVVVNKNDNCSNEFSTNLEIIKKITSKITYISNEKDIESLIPIFSSYKVGIDCLFGIGLNRELSGLYIGLIDTINRYVETKISIDVPSGLNADNGEVMGAAIKADITYTFEVIKRAFI